MKFKVGDYAKPRVWAERECPGYIELRAGYIKITNVNEDEPSYSYNVYSESGSLLYECNGCYGDSKLDSYTPTEEQSSFVEVPIGSENKIIYYDMSKNNEITIDGKRYKLEEIEDEDKHLVNANEPMPARQHLTYKKQVTYTRSDGTVFNKYSVTYNGKLISIETLRLHSNLYKAWKGRKFDE